jgi:hypothetical protein
LTAIRAGDDRAGAAETGVDPVVKHGAPDSVHRDLFVQADSEHDLLEVQQYSSRETAPLD